MKFEINPCKVCREQYNDINSINSCFAETTSAFIGIPSNNLITNNADVNNNWSKCMQGIMTEQGRTPCDFQLSVAPVWSQAPHHFPILFAETGDPITAKTQCLIECSKNNMKNECYRNCDIDFSAVKVINDVTKEKNESKKNVSKKNESKKNIKISSFPSNSETDNVEKTSKGMSIFIGVIFLIILILIPIGTYFSYKIRMARYEIATESMKQGNTSLAMTALAPEIGEGISSVFNRNNNRLR